MKLTISNGIAYYKLNGNFVHTSTLADRTNQSVSGTHSYFDDILSLEEKVSDAQAHGFMGITYWTIGGEADQPAGRTFFDMVRAHFPAQ